MAMIPCRVSVIVCTHNPNTVRLTRVLRALLRQTIDPDAWELLLVDNASLPPVQLLDGPGDLAKVQIIQEFKLGLTAARRAGVVQSRGEFIVFADDDNVLATDYLAQVMNGFDRLPRVGAIGGKSLGEFATLTEPWQREFFPLLALRDLGAEELYALPPGPGKPLLDYPSCAPIGAGMAIRRASLEQWLVAQDPTLTDRSGAELTSGGDNDLILHVLEAGWAVAYLPTLVLTHLIPDSRLSPRYLGRLNRGIQKSWMQVLRLHGINPWPRVPRWSVKLRQLKAWFTHRAWRDAAAYIRWQGACGHFEGRATNS